MLRLAIVDDEAPARANLRAALGTLAVQVEVVGEAHDVSSAIDLLEHLRPDVVFQDIQMPGATGFNVLEQAMERGLRPGIDGSQSEGGRGLHIPRQILHLEWAAGGLAVEFPFVDAE